MFLLEQLRPLIQSPWQTCRLDLVGIVAIASLDSVAERTVLRGTASLLDSLVICPGLHRQQQASDLAKAEYPACGAMTTGYVFRVENEATVYQLQRLGKPGHLTTLEVASTPGTSASTQQEPLSTPRDTLARICYLLAVLLCISTWTLIAASMDWWGATSLSILVLARLTNVIVIQRRAKLGWKGASEPGKLGDLLVLLSQDRWIRMRGLVDDLKTVTSGQWLRDPTFVESSFSSIATLLVYINVAVTANARQETQYLFLLLLLGSAALLGIHNRCTTELRMYDRLLVVDGEPKKYARRLDLAEELIRDTGRRDWAIRLGMVQAEKNDKDGTIDQGPKTM